MATAFAGGSVQHGLSAAGGGLVFYEHCSAADKRLSLGPDGAPGGLRRYELKRASFVALGFK